MRTGTYTYNRVKDRVAQGRKETNRDLFDSLMEAQDHKRGLEYRTKDLWIESMLLLTAGMYSSYLIVVKINKYRC